MQMAWGYAVPLIIEAALKLDLFEKLNRGRKTLADLVEETGASKRGLRGILNALVGFELLSKRGEYY